MKLFLSWSGERSQAIAAALRDWLPKVIQAIHPWMSAVDIDRGARWSSDIAFELEQTRFGILCLTPENLSSPWIHFEAGALSKTLEKTLVCPYLFELEPADLKGPLVQFHAAKGNKEETWKLLLTINDVQDTPLPKSTLDESFEVWWPKLEEKLTTLPCPQPQPKSERPEREILEEILELVRQQTRGLDARLYGARGPRPMVKVDDVCSKCGKAIHELPFLPVPGKPVKCSDCHAAERRYFSEQSTK
jgi:CxxC-x17-CxxC domain-containing protein